jgi:hypothetical protein
VSAKYNRRGSARLGWLGDSGHREKEPLFKKTVARLKLRRAVSCCRRVVDLLPESWCFLSESCWLVLHSPKSRYTEDQELVTKRYCLFQGRREFEVLRRRGATPTKYCPS